MKFNLTRPFQIAQWVSYILGVGILQIVVILPLAVLLFHDFYTRLLPSDSSVWVPLDNFNSNASGLNTRFKQGIVCVSPDKQLPGLKPNGLSQPIALRCHTNYKLDMKLEFYCHSLDAIGNSKGTDLQYAVVSLSDDSNLFYRYRQPVICRNQGATNVLEGNNHAKSRMEVLRNEWLNSLSLEDIADISPQLENIEISIDLPNSNGEILLEPTSGILVRRSFEQGLRNWMLRRWRTTYIIGTAVFYISLSFIFVITCMATFLIFTKVYGKHQKQ